MPENDIIEESPIFKTNTLTNRSGRSGRGRNDTKQVFCFFKYYHKTSIKFDQICSLDVIFQFF